MAVPTPTYTSDDVSTDWTEFGTPSYTDDQHSTSSAFDGDGVNDYLTRAGISSSGEDNVSVSFWMRASSNPSVEATPITQAASGLSALWEFRLTNTGTIAFVIKGSATTTASVSSISTNTVTDGSWHHIVCTAENLASTAADVNIYVDGSEVSYGTQDSEFLTGFNGFVNDTDMSIGSYNDALRFFNGDVSRPRVWADIVLTSAQALEEFDAECAAVVVPTTSYEDLDLSNGFTEFGSPTYVVDQFVNGTTAASFNGTTDSIERSQVITSGNQHSHSCWFKVAVGSSDSGVIMGQWLDGVGVSGDRGTFYLRIAGTTVRSTWIFTNDGSGTTSQTTTDEFRDGKWYHVLVTINGSSDCNIFINGVETGYAQQDSVFGSGFQGSNNAGTNLSFGNSLDSALDNYMEIIVARPKIWAGTVLSDCQILKEFNTECAAVLIPTSAFTSPDMSLTSAWSQSGSPAFIDGQHAEGSALDADGVNDLLQKADSGGIYSSGGTTFTVSAWIKMTNAPAGQIAIISNDQFNTSGNGGVFLWTTTTGIIACDAYSTNVNFVESVSNENILDDEWHYITATANSDTVRIYIDGVEVTYATENFIGGAGFGAGFNGNPLVMEVAGGLGFFEGVIDRTTFWLEDLSACQVLAQFNLEVSTIGFSPAITLPDETVTRLNQWGEFYDPGLKRVGTLAEPFDFGDVLTNATTSGQTLTTGNISRLNEWGQLDPALGVAGNSVEPFLFGNILNDAMGTPPITTQLTQKQIDDLNDWELSDPGLLNVQTPEEPFNLGDTLNTLLTRT